MTRHFILATDFSTRSDRALRRATMLARQLGAELSLVHVIDDDQPAELVRAQIRAARPVLDESVRTIEAHDGVAASAEIMTGDAAAGILEAADKANADLIIVGRHRRQLRDVFVGTTADRTVSRSRRPVLVAAGLPSANYARALVALDLEPPSQLLAAQVRDSGMLGAGETIAMHAFDAPARAMMRRGMSDQEAIDRYVRAERRRAAMTFRRCMAGSALATARTMVSPLNGSAARTIIEAAAEEDAALIVVGTSQRTGLERFVLGSVAQDVLARSDRDVLVVPNDAAAAEAGRRCIPESIAQSMA